MKPTLVCHSSMCVISLCVQIMLPRYLLVRQTYKRAALTLGIFMTLSLFIVAFDVYIMYYMYRKKLQIYLHSAGCGVFQTLSLPINLIHTFNLVAKNRLGFYQILDPFGSHYEAGKLNQVAGANN